MSKAPDIHQGTVRGYLHEPAGKVRASLVLTHGAGGNATMPLLTSVASAFAAQGFRVLRCDMPFRQKRPFGPPSPAGAAADQAGLQDAVELLRQRGTQPVFLGGQSYGGRQATLLAAAHPGVIGGLLLLSYPLHPPGKPQQLRTSHFPALEGKAVFVSGSKDPFGSPEELHAAISLIPAETHLVIVDGAGHDLLRGKFDIHALTVEPFLRICRLT